ncbi:carbohydrate diacid regulator [Streptomyces sp. AmelKG-E11A]|nr:sugar diacid recognition domain-containing protein [Streptomyces sp. SID4919]SCK47208.1 carbohydrate diacid regulator [Streptomyces sp. AmelKG-E11A]
MFGRVIAEATAQSIVDDIAGRLGVSVNIMDERGVIIASSDRSRVGGAHGGALHVLSTGMPLSVTAKEARSLDGTRAGVNLPLWLNGNVVGVVGVRGEPREVGEIARAVARLAELMVMQEAFLGEAGWRHRVRQQIMEDLLAARLTEEGFHQRQQLAGCRVEAPYSLFALRHAPAAACTEPRDLYRLLEVDERSALVVADAAGVVWTVTGGPTSVALRYRLSGLCAAHPGTGVLDAGRVDDFGALTELTGQARFALRRRLVGEVRLADLELPVLLARLDPGVRVETAERVLGALSAELRNTLRAYFAHDCGAVEAAQALNVHRNTLAYRLGRVAELTGRDPRAFQDAVVLQIALHLAEIDQDQPPR